MAPRPNPVTIAAARTAGEGPASEVQPTTRDNLAPLRGLKMPSQATFAHICLTVALLLGAFGMVPVALVGSSPTANADASSLPKQLADIIMLCGAIYLAVLQRSRAPNAWVVAAFVAATGWCALSISWSAAADVSIRRLVITIVMMLLVFLVCSISSPKTFLRYMSQLFLAVLIANFLAVAVLPAASTTMGSMVEATTAPGWRGLHIEKNASGAFAALGVFFCLYRAIDGEAVGLKRYLWIGAALAGMVFVYFSGSKTSFGITPGILVLGAVTVKMSETPARRWLLLLLLLAAVAVAFMLAPDMLRDAGRSLEAIGRDPTGFTGRTQIWAVAIRYAENYPWFGSGYGGFWAGPAGGIAQYAQGWVVDVPHAHNGYLNMQVQTGAIGLALSVLAAILVPLVVIVCRSDLPFAMRWLAVSVIWFFTFHNMLESSLFDRDNPVWVILLCVVMSVTTTRRAKRSAPVSASVRP